MPAVSSSPLHDVLAAHVARDEVPGLISWVSTPRAEHLDVIGAASPGGAPLERDAVFRISSMTKPIVAAAAMIALDDGALALDAPVERWLPELADRRVLVRLDGPLDETVPAARPITVHHVLSSTLGLGIVPAPPGTTPFQRALEAIGQGPPQPQRPPAPDAWLRQLAEVPLAHQPGEGWMYNTASDVLGVLLARATRQSLPDFLRERLFAPLGMRDTGFSAASARLLPELSRTRGTEAWTVDDPVDGQWSRPPALPGGASGLVSTIDDLRVFSELLVNGGEHRGRAIVSRAGLAAMTSDQLTPQARAGARWLPGFFEQRTWGFGLQIITGDDPSGPPGSYGWDGGLGTTWRIDPAARRIAILLTQVAWSSPVPPAVCLDHWRAARAVG